MSDVRKVMFQKGSAYMSIPRRAVLSFPLAKGDSVRIEQPFSRGLLVVPMDDGILAPSEDSVRMFGYATNRMDTEWLRARWQVTEPGGMVPCRGCRHHSAKHRIREVCLCEYCMVEIAAGIAFRGRPSQPELELGDRD